MSDILTSKMERGTPQIYRNASAGGVTFRVEFVGTGWVEFSVAPGAQFTVLGLDDVININIERYDAPGLRAVGDPDTETSSR
ncbi:hypothetical protein [Cypionkella psychrotolerans]|uniref:hypothetical protein n=1 Tax=Cypionkella psychrotolerans TaxID=1678131 RepID=UPI0006B583B8|nr:hypothetical protein [Cypionkella psychrotolerans]